MNNLALYESIKLKAELSFDLLKESKDFKTLHPSFQNYLCEAYDLGANYGAALVLTEGTDVDEGFFDRFKANVARFGQGVKNVTGLGQQTQDSKDAAAKSLFANFQKKMTPLLQKPKETPQQANQPPKIAAEIENDLNRLDKKATEDPAPSPSQQQAASIVQQSNAPKSLKDKILNAIRQNPGKIKFLLGALSFGAGVAATTMAGGSPLAGKIAGALINGIGNAALAKIQGRGTGDAAMSGLGGALAGGSLASAGENLTNMIGNAAEDAVDKLHDLSKRTFGSEPQITIPRHGGHGGGFGGGGRGFGGDITGIDPSLDAGTDIPAPASDGPSTSKVTGIDPSLDAGTDIPAEPTDIQSTSRTTGIDPSLDAGTDILAEPTDVSTETPTDIPAEPTEVPAQAPAATPGQSEYQRQRAWMRKNPGAKGAQLLMKPWNQRPTFEQVSKNTFKLGKNSIVKETLKEARELDSDQKAALNDFLDDLGKMFNVTGAGSEQGRKAVIDFMKSQGTRFQDILNYLNTNQLISGAAAPQPQQRGLPANVINDINIKIKSLLGNLTIINPKIPKLVFSKITRMAGKNSSMVFKLNKSGDVAFIIKGYIGEIPFLYQVRPSDAQQYAMKVLVKEIKFKPIDEIRTSFAKILGNTLSLYYIKNQKQLIGNLDQKQLNLLISTYLIQYSKTNADFKKMFDSITILLDNVLNRMKISKAKPENLWIGITAKGINFFRERTKQELSAKKAPVKKGIAAKGVVPAKKGAIPVKKGTSQKKIVQKLGPGRTRTTYKEEIQ